MTATKGKVQGRQAELQLHKNPNAAFYFYKAKGRNEVGWLISSCSWSPRREGTIRNLQCPKGEHSQHCSPPADTWATFTHPGRRIVNNKRWISSGWEMHPNQPVLWWTGVRLGWGVWSSQLGIPKLGGWFGTENSSHPGIPLWQAEIKARAVSGRLQEALGVPWVLREEGIPAFGRHCRDFPGLTLLPFRRAS